jgi:RimJ/RimL family protein N-acetyltransferase
MFARTERLLLRPAWGEDAPALFSAIADERIVRNLASAPWPYLPEHAQAYAGTERRPGEPSFLIFRRTAGDPRLVGAIGMGPRPDGELELGYWIARPFWGLGYATEAGAAVLRLARDGLRLPRLSAGHFLDNPASGRVLQKLGFRPTGAIVPRFSVARGEAAPCRLFELDFADEEASTEQSVELVAA